MTTSAEIFALVHAAVTDPVDDGGSVTYPTAAGERVVSPGDLPTQDDQYPVLKLRLIAEAKQSLGRATIEFTTVCTIRVTAQVSAPAEVGSAAASLVESRLWALQRQAEVAIINSGPLFAVVQQLASVQSQFTYTGEAATHLAGMQSDYAFEFYEGPESFAAVPVEDLVAIGMSLPPFPGATSVVDLT